MCFFSIELLGQDVFNSKYSVKTNLFPNEAIPQFLLEENPLPNELQNENACSNVMLRKFVDSNFPAGSFLQRKFYTEANDLSLSEKTHLPITLNLVFTRKQEHLPGRMEKLK